MVALGAPIGPNDSVAAWSMDLPMSIVAALALSAAVQGMPDEYPFGPFEDAESAAIAERTERRLTKPDGIDVAVELTCDTDFDGASYDVDKLVASEFLIQHFEKALPALLERVRRGDADDSTDHARLCSSGARGLIDAAICFGYSVGGSGPALDAHPHAVAARARAARTFVKALEARHLRADLLLDVMLEARTSGRAARANSLEFTDLCTGGNDLIFQATRPLLGLLGAPSKKSGLPPDFYAPATNRDKAFRLLSYGVADRRLAEATIRPFLDHAETAPIAAVTLQRMGVDASEALPRLERTLDQLPSLGFAGSAEPGMSLFEDAQDLVALLGPRANAALPALGRFAARWELPQCRTFGLRRYLELARIGNLPNNPRNSIALLVPLLHCPQGNDVAWALGAFGPAATDPLLAAVRDPSLAQPTRVAAAVVLSERLHHRLSDADGALVPTLRSELEGRGGR